MAGLKVVDQQSESESVVTAETVLIVSRAEVAKEHILSSSSKSKRVQALKCTKSIKEYKLLWSKLTEAHNILIEFKDDPS